MSGIDEYYDICKACHGTVRPIETKDDGKWLIFTVKCTSCGRSHNVHRRK